MWSFWDDVKNELKSGDEWICAQERCTCVTGLGSSRWHPSTRSAQISYQNDYQNDDRHCQADNDQDQFLQTKRLNFNSIRFSLPHLNRFSPQHKMTLLKSNFFLSLREYFFCHFLFSKILSSDKYSVQLRY